MGVNIGVSGLPQECNLSIGVNITPWFHASWSIGGNGLSISFGIDIGDTSHDFTIGVGLAPLAIFAGIALIIVTAGTAIDIVSNWFSKIFSL